MEKEMEKENNEQKLVILKKYFDKWVLLSNLYKYIGKAKNEEEKKQKFFGTLNMINGLSSYTKRQVHKNTKEPIANYLKDLLKQKILYKIMTNIRKKCLDILLRKKFNQWRLATNRKKLYKQRSILMERKKEKILIKLNKKSHNLTNDNNKEDSINNNHFLKSKNKTSRNNFKLNYTNYTSREELKNSNLDSYINSKIKIR